MATAAELIGRYPELEDANDRYPAMVTACIAQATTLVDVSTYGTRYSHAVLAFAAHLVATNPLGEPAGLRMQPDGTTDYLHEYKRLQRASIHGPLLV